MSARYPSMEQQIACAPQAPRVAMQACDDDAERSFSEDSCSGDDVKTKMGQFGADMCESSASDDGEADGYDDCGPTPQPMACPPPAASMNMARCGDQMPIASPLPVPVPQQQQQQQFVGAQMAPVDAVAAAEELAAARRERHARKKAAAAAAARAAAPAAPVSMMSSGAAAAKSAHQDKTVTVQLLVKISASPNDLARDPARSVWAMKPTQVHVYQKRVKDAKTGQYVMQGDPSKAVIQSIVVKKVCNKFPVDIGVVSDEVPGAVTLSDGRKMMYVADVDESGWLSETVHTSDGAIDDKRMSMYGSYTREQLRETFGPLPGAKNAGYSMVLPGSPLLRVLEMNQKHELFADAYAGRVETPDYVKLKTSVVDTLYNETCQMLDNLPHTDLTKFNVRIVRADGRSWADAEGVESMFDSADEKTRVLARQYTFTMLLEMTHVLTTIDSKNSKA